MSKHSTSKWLTASAEGQILSTGQTRETRVIRLLARNTIEEGIVKEQERKMSMKTGQVTTMADVDPNTLIAIVKDHLSLSADAASLAADATQVLAAQHEAV